MKFAVAASLLASAVAERQNSQGFLNRLGVKNIEDQHKILKARADDVNDW